MDVGTQVKVWTQFSDHYGVDGVVVDRFDRVAVVQLDNGKRRVFGIAEIRPLTSEERMARSLTSRLELEGLVSQ